MEGYIGEIRLFAFSKAPKGWALCDGSVLPVNGNQALFSVMGKTYGGDGITNFALPDLRGRVPMHGSKVAGIRVGDKGGVDSVSLTAANLPAHTHTICVDSNAATQVGPAGAIPAAPAKVVSTDPDAPYMYAQRTSATSSVAMDPSIVAVSGAGAPHENRQPFQVVNYCICISGLYPPRN